MRKLSITSTQAAKISEYLTSNKAISVLVEALKRQGLVIGDAQHLQLNSSSLHIDTATFVVDTIYSACTSRHIFIIIIL